MVVIEFKRTTPSINPKFSNDYFHSIEQHWFSQLLPKNDIIRITQN